MFRILASSILAVALVATASMASANSGPPDCWEGDDQLCDPCHMGGYTGVCVQLDCDWLDDDDDSSQVCEMTCATNADADVLEQCPDADLPSCECSASGAMGVATIPAFTLLLGLAVSRRRRGGQN